MSYERIFGLAVVDEGTYTEYRKEMRPLLEQAGGSFRYDFAVARVIHSERSQPINRAFVMRFPSRADSEQFFADPRYLEIRRRLFEPSVAGTVLIAEYETKAA